MDLLDSLLIERSKEDNMISDGALMAECLTFIVAGSETSSNTLSFSLYCLALFPEIQEKLYNEIKNAIGEGKELSVDNISNIEYLEWFLNEVLRIYPVAPILGRRIETEVKLGKYMIPKNTSVLMDFAKIHTDGTTWERPNEFDPERFRDYKNTGRKNFVPFGGGKRICVGKNFAMVEMETLLVRLLLMFKFEPTVELKWPIETHLKFTMGPKKNYVSILKRD